MRPMPYSVIGLIEELEVQFPPRCKTPDESLEAHAHYAGKVALINHLRDRYEAVNKAEQSELPKILKG